MCRQEQFKKLFEASQIGEMTLRNRIVMLPMGTGYSSQQGYVTQPMIDYYEKRAKGGVGLVIVEVACVESRRGRIYIGRNGLASLCIDDDKFVSGLAQLARAIQRHGARAAIQLQHSGSAAKSKITGLQPVAPSPIPLRLGSDAVATSDLPRELTISEIKEIVDRFAKGAERAKKAGFDGVELHGAHWYLIAQFLSSEYNQRRDGYGGDLKSRMRFLLEIIEAIRQSVGQTYPVWCRINGGGTGLASTLTLDELRNQAKILEESGVDAISISGISPTRPHFSAPGYFVDLSEAVKKVVRIPVIIAGGIDPDLGERLLQEGKADFIGIGRGLIADPDLSNKVASGKLEDIVPCIRCLHCLDSILFGLGGGPLECTVNAAVGRERECRTKPARKSKRILVVGGGPAGMEAARVAAARGHQVVLCESSDKLGGQLLLASKPPHKDLIANLTSYLEGQIRKLGVEIQLGKSVDPALIDSIKPDVVILATGIVPFIPEILGISRDNVVTAQDVLSGKVEAGQRVAVIGGELVGCETAMFLVEKGKKVTILRRGPEIAAGVMPRVREPLLNILIEMGVSMLGGVKYHEITDKGLVITDTHGHKQIIEVDTIVLAAGAKPNREILGVLQGRVSEIYLAGDCVKPGNIWNAIHDGFHISNML